MVIGQIKYHYDNGPIYNNDLIIILSTVFCIPLLTFSIFVFGIIGLPLICYTNKHKYANLIIIFSIIGSNVGVILGFYLAFVFFSKDLLKEDSPYQTDIINGRYLLYLVTSSLSGFVSAFCSTIFIIVADLLSQLFDCII